MRRLLCTVLALGLLAGCQKVLHSRLAEREVNEMVAVLDQNGIAAEKVEGQDATWKLEVPAGDFARAQMVLEDHGLPHKTYASIGQVFKREGLVSTPSEERIRFIDAQQQELANTLSQLDGVITARVHVVIPQNDPLADKVKPASASVFIKHRPEVDLNSMVPQIKALVARSVEGLAHDNVSLSLFPARTRAAATAPAAGPPMAGALERAGWLLVGAALGVALVWAVLAWSGRRRKRSSGLSPVAGGERVTSMAGRRRASETAGTAHGVDRVRVG